MLFLAVVLLPGVVNASQGQDGEGWVDKPRLLPVTLVSPDAVRRGVQVLADRGSPAQEHTDEKTAARIQALETKMTAESGQRGCPKCSTVAMFTFFGISVGTLIPAMYFGIHDKSFEGDESIEALLVPFEESEDGDSVMELKEMVASVLRDYPEMKDISPEEIRIERADKEGFVRVFIEPTTITPDAEEDASAAIHWELKMLLQESGEEDFAKWQPNPEKIFRPLIQKYGTSRTIKVWKKLHYGHEHTMLMDLQKGVKNRTVHIKQDYSEPNRTYFKNVEKVFFESEIEIKKEGLSEGRTIDELLLELSPYYTHKDDSDPNVITVWISDPRERDPWAILEKFGKKDELWGFSLGRNSTNEAEMILGDPEKQLELLDSPMPLEYFETHELDDEQQRTILEILQEKYSNRFSGSVWETTKEDHRMLVRTIILIVVSVICLALAAFIFCCCFWTRRKAKLGAGSSGSTA